MAFLGTMVSVEVKTMDGKYFEGFREIVLNFYFILFQHIFPHSFM